MGVTGNISYTQKYGTLNRNEIGGDVNVSMPYGTINMPKVYSSFKVNSIYSVISFPDIYIVNLIYEPEAEALFARMTGQPTNSLKLLINKTIKDYKACGYWDLCDVIVKFNTLNEQAGLLNWKGDLYNPINVNGCAFTPYIGFQGDGISKVINTKFKRNTAGNKYTLNNAHFYRNISALSTAAATLPVGDGGGNGAGGLTVFGNSPSNYVNYARMNGSAITTGQLQGAIGHSFLGRINPTQIHQKVNALSVDVSQARYSMTSEEQHLFGMIWGIPTSAVTYKHNARYYGYSFGAFVNDEMADSVMTINDFFNTNVGETF